MQTHTDRNESISMHRRIGSVSYVVGTCHCLNFRQPVEGNEKVVGSLLHSEGGVCHVYRRGDRTESESEKENVGYGVGEEWSINIRDMESR